MKYTKFESVLELIRAGGFGSYLLYSSVGGELLAGSHLTSEDNKDILQMSVQDLIREIQTKVDLYGYGSFKISLKKNNKTPNGNAVIYYFQVLPEGQQQQQPQQVNGFGSLEGAESIIEKRVREQLEGFKKDLLHQQTIADLQRQLSEAKKEKTAPGMEQFGEVMKMGMGFILAKYAPEAIPAVNAMLGNVPSEPMEKPQAFTRTD